MSHRDTVEQMRERMLLARQSDRDFERVEKVHERHLACADTRHVARTMVAIDRKVHGVRPEVALEALLRVTQSAVDAYLLQAAASHDAANPEDVDAVFDYYSNLDLYHLFLPAVAATHDDDVAGPAREDGDDARADNARADNAGDDVNSGPAFEDLAGRGSSDHAGTDRDTDPTPDRAVARNDIDPADAKRRLN